MDDHDDEELASPPAKRLAMEPPSPIPSYHSNLHNSDGFATLKRVAEEAMKAELCIAHAAEFSCILRSKFYDVLFTALADTLVRHICGSCLGGVDPYIGSTLLPVIAAVGQSHKILLDPTGSRRREQVVRGLECNLAMYGGSGEGKSPAFEQFCAIPLESAASLIRENRAVRGGADTTVKKTSLMSLGDIREVLATNISRICHMAEAETNGHGKGRGGQVFVATCEGAQSMSTLLQASQLQGPSVINNLMDGKQTGMQIASNHERIVNRPHFNVCVFSQNQTLQALIGNPKAMECGLLNRINISLMSGLNAPQMQLSPDSLPTQRSNEDLRPGKQFDFKLNLEAQLQRFHRPRAFITLVFVLVDELCHDRESTPIDFDIVMNDEVYARFLQIEAEAKALRTDLKRHGAATITSLAKLPTNVLSWSATIHLLEIALRFATAFVSDIYHLDVRCSGAAFASAAPEPRENWTIDETLAGVFHLFRTTDVRLTVDGCQRLIRDRARHVNVDIVAAKNAIDGDRRVLADSFDFSLDDFKCMETTAALDSARAMWIDSASTVILLMGAMNVHNVLMQHIPEVKAARKDFSNRFPPQVRIGATVEPSNCLGVRSDEQLQRAAGAFVLVAMNGFEFDELKDVAKHFGGTVKVFEVGSMQQKRRTLLDRMRVKGYDLSDVASVFPLPTIAASWLSGFGWNFAGTPINATWCDKAFKQLAADGIGEVILDENSRGRIVQWLAPHDSRFPSADQTLRLEAPREAASQSVASGESTRTSASDGALHAKPPFFRKLLPTDASSYNTMRDTLCQRYGLTNIIDTFIPKEDAFGQERRQERGTRDQNDDDDA